MSECCERPHLREVDKVWYSLKESLLEDSQELSHDLLWQEGYCPTPRRRNLLSYFDAVSRYRKQLLQNLDICLCCEDAVSLLANAKTAIGPLCDVQYRKDFTVDTSKFSEWVLKNPTLVDYNEWEKCLYDVAFQLNIQPGAVKVEDLCGQIEVIFEVHKLDCSTDNPIETQVVKCDLTPTVDIDLESCKIEFNEIETKFDNCDFTLNEYVEMKQCGFTFDLITKALECDVAIDIQPGAIKICPSGQDKATVTVIQ